MANGSNNGSTTPPVSSHSSWTAIIEVVKTPLAFLVLGFLIVDGTVAALAIQLPEYRSYLIRTVILAIPFFVLTVVGLAIFRPEALRGERALQQIFATQFASDLFIGLDGALRNLEKKERIEAWSIAAEVITTTKKNNKIYSDFCDEVANKIKQLANIRLPIEEPRGSVHDV